MSTSVIALASRAFTVVAPASNNSIAMFSRRAERKRQRTVGGKKIIDSGGGLEINPRSIHGKVLTPAFTFSSDKNTSGACEDEAVGG
ncbi:MAG: hypothetical protein LAO24_15185 [Acidobacteriia bacterium]|nr:hypothetical protein [Terriglobia bacterium]